MKICIITPVFSHGVGGRENYIINLAEHLRKHDEVVVVTTTNKESAVNTPFGSTSKIIEIKPSNVASIQTMLTYSPNGITLKKLIWHFF